MKTNISYFTVCVNETLTGNATRIIDSGTALTTVDTNTVYYPENSVMNSSCSLFAGGSNSAGAQVLEDSSGVYHRTTQQATCTNSVWSYGYEDDNCIDG